MIKEKISGSFTSSNGIDEVKYYIYLPDSIPSAIVQISHGMCEYTERYEKEGLVQALTDAGFVVCGNDHLGHGTTADADLLGFFTDYKDLVNDNHILNSIIRKRYPSLPYILYGHSMGSFVARNYLTEYSDIDGAIISGTSSGDQPLNAAKLLSSLICKMRGKKHRSKLLHKLAFGNYNKRFEEENDEYSWISSDSSVRDRYRGDPFCTYNFTAVAYRELAKLLVSISSAEWVEKVPLSLPIFLIAGNSDPVADNGDGIKQLYEALEEHEMNDLKMKLYNGRHEIHNDICRDEVISDVIEWINGVAEGVIALRSFNSLPIGRVDFN